MTNSTRDQWKDVVVILRQPTNDSLMHMDRGERYNLLRKANELQLKRLLKRLKYCGIADQAEIDRPTAFRLLFVHATQKAIDCISGSPDVVGILPNTGEITVDLPGAGNPNGA
jgi:hypothetical protein